eukprot:205840-Pelagomonas_calceolata.AAC.1
MLDCSDLGWLSRIAALCVFCNSDEAGHRLCGALRAHTLTVETASWEDGTSPMCDRCSCGQIQDEVHVLFM